MEKLYPIVRRVRRPLLPEEPRVVPQISAAEETSKPAESPPPPTPLPATEEKEEING